MSQNGHRVPRTSTQPLTIWTIGHSTRTLDEFVGLLVLHEISALVDVRRFAGSRKYPHFNHESLKNSLARVGIDYIPMPGLGGRRQPRNHSRNTVWRNASFRGYADHMETSEFRTAIVHLTEIAQEKRTVVMCAEAVWWRCHRALIADCLKAAGYRVCHILDAHKTEEHPYTSAARIENGKLSYAPAT